MQAQQQCQQVLENIQKSLWTADAEGRLIFITRETASLYGYEPEEMIGRFLTDFQSLDIDADFDITNFLHQISIGETYVQGEFVQRRKNGADFRLLLNACALRNSEGMLTCIAGIALPSHMFSHYY
jgi:two-component system, sensor histidine kinase and response regulator